MMINLTERESYLLDKLSEKNYYTWKGDDRVLKDDVPDEIREADRELREIINNKHIPESCM